MLTTARWFTVSSLLTTLALLAGPGCGGDDSGTAAQSSNDVMPGTVEQGVTAAPVSQILTFEWQGQQTHYWCGPGSTRIALSTRVTPPSQTTLANELPTTTNGTDHVGLVVNVLNRRFARTVYSVKTMQDPPTAAERTTLKQALVATLSNGFPLVANVVSGWRPPGYPTGTTIYHYVAVVGYDQSGDRALIADPAGGCAVWCSVPKSYWITTTDLGTWIGGKGYTWTGLPIATPPAPTGNLVGVLYQNGNMADRVVGANVVVSGKTVTTGTDGTFKFALPAGTYTATATKAGYATASVTRTVTVGTDTWGSMEMHSSTGTGILQGKVFAYNATTPTDESAVLSGVTVTAGSKTVMTGADGTFSFTLPVGTYTVTASKSGYSTMTFTRSTTVGGTTTLPIALTASTGTDVQGPVIDVFLPVNNAHVDVASFELSGSVVDDRGSIANVTVSLNDSAGVNVATVDRAFHLPIKLRPGANTLVVSAKDAAGNVSTRTLTSFFDAGLKGFVHVEGDDNRRVANAVVKLLADDGTLLVQTPVDPQTGEYSLLPSKLPMTGELLVEAPGYLSAREDIAISDDARLTKNVALSVAAVPLNGEQDRGTDPPNITTRGCSASGTPEEAGVFALVLVALCWRSRLRSIV